MSEGLCFDIVIAGAGPTGLALALLLVQQDLSIGIIEKLSNDALKSAPYDGREIALTHASWLLLMEMGAAAYIDSRHVSRVHKARVMNGRSDYALTLSADDVNETHMGCMLSNHLIRQGLYRAALDHKNITILTEQEIIAARTNDTGAWVGLRSGEAIHASLLVAADSRFSKIRDMMGITARRHDFKRACIVCRIRHEKDLQRTAYEIFGVKRTIAVLPLENNQASLVVTISDEQSRLMTCMAEDDFVRHIASDLRPLCGEIELISERFSYPLVGVHADLFYKKRFALIGDAAVGMHPVTAHGFNLGLSGARVLASEIKKGQAKGWDFWDERILATYDRRHKRKTIPLYHGTNAIVKLYVRTGPLSRIARRALLHAGNAFAPAKRMIVRSLTDKMT